MNYYVNNKAHANGDQEVHRENCQYLPLDRKYVGNYATCEDAVREAKKIYPNSNGCYTCSRECHTG
jgi:hypothetical protein